MLIRPARQSDLDALWELWNGVMQERVFFPHLPETSRKEIERSWLNFNNHLYVSEAKGEIDGGYALKANQPGYGSHIANAAYMVNPNARGSGLGHKLCIHSIKSANQLGFRGLQFNMVVSSNLPAIKVWESHGFKKIGKVPDGFYHYQKGYIDAYIYFRDLTQETNKYDS